MNVELVSVAVALSVFVIYAATTTELLRPLAGRRTVPSRLSFLARDLPTNLLPQPIALVAGLLIAAGLQQFVLYIVVARASELTPLAAAVLWGEIVVAAGWAVWLTAQVHRGIGRSEVPK